MPNRTPADRHLLARIVGSLPALMLLGSTSALAAGPFDGTYAGTRTITRGSPPTCTEGPQTVTVSNGQLSVKYGVGEIQTAVAPDGTFKGNAVYTARMHMSQATTSGRITGNTLEASLGGEYCDFHLSMKKR